MDKNDLILPKTPSRPKDSDLKKLADFLGIPKLGILSSSNLCPVCNGSMTRPFVGPPYCKTPGCSRSKERRVRKTLFIDPALPKEIIDLAKREKEPEILVREKEPKSLKMKEPKIDAK